MWYQFNENGVCVSSSSGEVEQEDGFTSVYHEEVFSDIENQRLVNGAVQHIAPNN